MIAVTLGTGVGGGIIIDRKVYTGLILPGPSWAILLLWKMESNAPAASTAA